MPTVYDYLPAAGRPPLDSLDERSRAFLSTEIPEGYPQSKLVRIVDMASKGLGRRARPTAPPAAAPPGEMLPAHGPSRGIYEAWPRGKQLYAQAMEGVGRELSQEPLDVPPPADLAEHVASLVGTLPAFAAKAAVLQGAGAPAALAVGGSMAASRGTPNERLVRGVTGAATAGVAGAAGKALQPLVGQAGHVATTAVGFGAAQPALESLTHRLTGEPNYPAPTLADLVRGTAEMAVIAGAPGAAGWAMGRGRAAGGSKAEVLPDQKLIGKVGRGDVRDMPSGQKQLPQAPLPKSRQLPPAPAAPGPAIEMPAGEGAPPAVFPVSRRLPGGPLRSSGEVFEMGAGKTVQQNRAPVVAKLAPELANDGRLVAAGRTVGDVFHEMVAAEAGNATDRASWKAAVRKVVASGRIQAVQDIAAALTEPGPQARRAPPEMRAREARFTEELNARAAGRTVTLNLGGSPTQLRVARVVSFRYPGVDRPIRVVAEDPANGRLFPLQFRSVAELAQAVNNPQAMVKVEDVFARSERQRAVKAAAPPPAGARPATTPTTAGTTAPVAPAAGQVPPREGPKMSAQERGMNVELRKGPPKPVPAAKSGEYVRRMGEGYAAMHGKLDTKMQGELVQRLETQARDKGADPADRRGAIEALRLIRGGAAGPGVEPGTGPKAPPAAPPKAPKPAPARPRSAIGMEFSDPKKAQAIADRLNRENPDVEAAVAMRRGKPVVEVNTDAAVAPPKPKPAEKPAPKAEPAAAPAEPEPKAAEAAKAPPKPKAEKPAAKSSEPEPVSPEVAAAGPRLRQQQEIENNLRLEGIWQRLMVARESDALLKAVGELTPAEARKMVDRLDAAPGDNPAARQALERVAEKKAAERAADAGRASGGSEPPAAPAAKPDAVAEVADLEAKSRFKRDARVSVPNNAIRRNDGRARVQGRVVGHTMKNGEPAVIVAVRRGTGRSQSKNLVERARLSGKFSWHEETVLEKDARLMPTPASRKAAAQGREAQETKQAASIRAAAAGSPAKARAIVRQWEERAQEFKDAAPQAKFDERTGRSLPLTPEQDKAVVRANEGWRRSMRVSAVADAVRRELVAEKLAGREALHPDIEPFFSRSEDRPDWVEPLREAAEDFPDHFTHERQAGYLRMAASYNIANATEWKATLDFERGMAERGVAPEHAAYATNVTARVRRMLEQDADNPLMDDAERAAARERWLAPGRIDTPTELLDTMKKFDAEHPVGPADDIPAGVQPVPPEGFVEGLNERGMAKAELLAPWLWLKALRDIPKNWAKARRNVERAQRQYTVTDGSGNIVERGDHALYEPDYYSQSALTRLLAWAGVEPGAHVLTPELRSSYKSSLSQHARIKSGWRFELFAKLGPDLAQKVRVFSKHSKQLDRVLEGLAPESSLPADIRPAVQAFKDWYAERWRIIKAAAEALGEEPPTSKLEGRYVGPRLILGHISKTTESMFADLLGEGRVTPEITEQRNRFLHERTGDPVYREDAMYRAVEYIDTMSRYLAHRRFFKDVKEFVEANRLTDHRRAGAIVNLLKATLLRKKGWFERQMDAHLANVRFAESPPEIREEPLEAAAKEMGVTVAQLKKGSGLERVFVVPRGARYRVGGDAKAFDLKRLDDGSMLVGTGGAHLFGELPKLWKPEADLKRRAIRAEVGKLAALEAANKKLTGEEGGYLSPHFSKDEHVQMMFDQWRDGVLRSRNDLTAAAFRGVGDRITRAVLGRNLRATLANSMQPWLTLAPEIGYRRTLQAVIENALGEKRGKLTAEMTGSLQGELARADELTSQMSWFRKMNDAFGGMSGYKYAEDFTRGVGMMAGEIMARRLGYKPGVAMDLSGEINPRFFDDWRRKADAVRESGTTENLQATLDTETMFDYNMLGQSPIFGGALGKVLGRLMTFPGRYARRYVTRPLGGSAKVARALVLGGADRATGGALAAAGMKVGPGKRFENGRRVRGKYPGPANAFEDFLEHYGAREYDRQGARVLLRQLQGIGFLAGLTAATGLNAFIVGTPGWERLPLMALLALTPKGSVAHARIKRLLDATQRSAIVDPERGVESTMSPLLRTGYTFIKESPQAWAAAYNKAQESDPAGAASAFTKPLRKAAQETGLQMTGLPIVAIRRAFQQMPNAEAFFSTDAGKGFAQAMGIRSYIKGNGATGFIKGTFGLTPVAEEEAKRVRIDQKPKAVRRRRPRSRGSIYGTLLGGGAQEAFA